MRPQRNAGENRLTPYSGNNSGISFNEAPAKCRGKPDGGAFHDPDNLASMRPQRNAGENERDWTKQDMFDSQLQ